MDFVKIRFWWIQTQKKIKILFGATEDDSWDFVFDKSFNRLAILQQTDERKSEISQAVNEGIKTNKLYWLEVTLSALIATFGLMQNSVAVIIGAMLIAPLLRPIQGLAYSIVLGRPYLFARAFRLLALSVLVSILVPIVVLYFFPGTESTSEIAARTQPNLLDLLIAIFSAVVAILAFAYKRLNESVAGVAMATAIMPPLVVIGMQIWWGNWELALGATLLFLTNLVATLAVGAVLFIFYGFNPHRSETESSLGKLAFLFLTLLGLWLVLSYNLKQIEIQRQQVDRTQIELQKLVKEKIPGAGVEDISLTDTKEALEVSGKLVILESQSITRATFSSIENSLAEALQENVVLKLDLVRTLRFNAAD